MAATAFLSLLKSRLPQIAASRLGQVKSMAESRVNQVVEESVIQLQDSCPNPAVLARLSQSTNNLNNLLNKYRKTLTQVKAIPNSLNPLLQSTTVLVNLLSSLPIPSSVPPGIGVPIGVLNTQSEILVFGRRLIESLGDDQRAILSMVESVESIFNPLFARIKTLQQLIDNCSRLSEEERKSLISQIRGGDRRPSQSGGTAEEYTASNGNTYTLEIIDEVDTTGPTSRRRAVAKDFRGIIVLRGPFSFASSTQILFDELKFRLDNNLP